MPLRAFRTVLALFGVAMPALSGYAASPTVASAIWAFPTGGYSPQGPVTLFRGHVFGTATLGGTGKCTDGLGCGTIFELSRSTQGWTAETLYNFQGGADGYSPEAPLTVSRDGTLYSTTNADSNGTVFSLTPPVQKGSGWTYRLLYTFPGGQHANLAFVYAGLILRDGHLFGIASGGDTGACGQTGCGSVFRLDPGRDGGPWTRTTLYRFDGGANGGGPGSIVGFDASGALYVSTLVGGTVVRLTPSPQGGSPWNAQVIATFDTHGNGGVPQNLILSPSGVLYGVVANSRFGPPAPIFSLTPPASAGGAWTKAIIAKVRVRGYGPNSMVLGHAGSLVGVVYGDQDAYAGDAFQLTPPADPGSAWIFTQLWGFGRGPDTNPIAITAAPDGDFYGVLNNTYDNGAVFKLRPRR